MEIIKNTDLKQMPMLYLSLGSKELFHSNFLYWLGICHRQLFEKVMTKLCHINAAWPADWMVRREHRHLDLCVTDQKDKCAFIVVENKVKSLPDRIQLKRYEGIYKNRGCSYVLLSLIKEFAGQREIQESTIWQLHHFDELSEILLSFASSEEMPESDRVYINDYCHFIKALSQQAESWKMELNQPHLLNYPELQELRLNDVYQKLRYSQMATLLAKSLDAEKVAEVILGMSNFEVIIGKKDEEIQQLYFDDDEPKPFQHIFISSNLLHGLGLVEAKIKVSDDCCYVVQLQGNRYCHGIERDGIRYVKLTKEEMCFIDFINSGLKSGETKTDAQLCHYKDGFIYKWQKVDTTLSIGELIDAMKVDLLSIINERYKMKGKADNLRKILDAKSDEELVGIIAEEYVDSGFPKEKLLEAGRDGIVKARKLYNENNDFCFNAYAVWWIRQRILQAINEKD